MQTAQETSDAIRKQMWEYYKQRQEFRKKTLEEKADIAFDGRFRSMWYCFTGIPKSRQNISAEIEKVAKERAMKFYEKNPILCVVPVSEWRDLFSNPEPIDVHQLREKNSIWSFGHDLARSRMYYYLVNMQLGDKEDARKEAEFVAQKL